MIRYLVTGAGGVVGHALVQHLRAKGADVTGLASRADCDLENWNETHSIFKFVRPTHVFHIAGAVYGLGGNLKFPGDTFRRNILINTHVIDAGYRTGVQKVVAMGSAAMYADGLKHPLNEDDALTGVPHHSEFGYAFTKRSMLVQLQSYQQQFGTQFAFAIATNMYGAHDRFNTAHGHVIPSLIRKFVEAERTGDSIEIWGDGSPTRDFLYSQDAAAALDLMMEKGAGAYNIATGKSRSIRELVEAIARLCPNVKYTYDTSKPLGQVSRSYDIERITGLGFAPKFALEEGVKLTVDWVRKHLDALRD